MVVNKAAVVAKVPVVGNVTAVLPVNVKSTVKAPIVVNAPPKTMGTPIFETVTAPVSIIDASPDMATADARFPASPTKIKLCVKPLSVKPIHAPS